MSACQSGMALIVAPPGNAPGPTAYETADLASCPGHFKNVVDHAPAKARPNRHLTKARQRTSQQIYAIFVTITKKTGLIFTNPVFKQIFV